VSWDSDRALIWDEKRGRGERKWGRERRMRELDFNEKKWSSIHEKSSAVD
jgi:hypothetical protein